jgi:hypothetical protein
MLMTFERRKELMLSIRQKAMELAAAEVSLRLDAKELFDGIEDLAEEVTEVSTNEEDSFYGAIDQFVSGDPLSEVYVELVGGELNDFYTFTNESAPENEDEEEDDDE